MIKRLVLFLAFWMLPAASALAANFVANIDSDHITAGKSFTLQLALSGAQPTSDPDVGALKQGFTIVSEAQSSNTTIVNGVVSSSVGWQLAMIPRQEGQVVIPSVSVETNIGPLRTAPITLEVSHGAAASSSQITSDGSMVSVTARASTTTPYQNQSIRYTVRVVLRGNPSDVSLSDIAVNNAIVEPEDKPEVHSQVENGAVVRVGEFSYIITPLQPGKVTIPPVTVRGKIEAPNPAPLNDPFGGGFSYALQQAMNYFSANGRAPFSVMSNQMLLDVKPPAAAMDPWLPLTSLKIIEDIDTSRPIRVGEPLTRKLTLLADGAVGKQLPDLEAKQDHANFKVYADKPTTGEDIDAKSGEILGWRKESYSLVALKPGRLILPAIHVTWWDIVNNKAAIAELPERVVNVLPGVVVQNSPAVGTMAQLQGKKAGPFAPPLPFRRQPVISRPGATLLYVLMGALAAGLLFAVFLGLKVRRKINRSKADAPVLASKKIAPGKAASKPITGNRLKSIHTAAELKNFLQEYAYEHLGVSRNASLEIAFSALSGSKQEIADIEVVTRGIAAALYADKTVDVEDLKKRSLRIIAALREEGRVRRKRLEKLGCLNPS